MNVKLRLMIVLGILGLVLTYMGGRDWIVLSKPAKDITELWEVDYHDLKAGDHVCFDVNLVWDQIGSETTTSKTYGVTTSERESARYYLLPFCRDREDGYLYPTPYLMVKLGSQYNSLMSTQISKTDEWWSGNGDYSSIPSTSIHMDGKLVKMPNDIRKQLKATLEAGEDIEDYMIPVIFERIAAQGAVKGMTIAGIVMIMCFLVMLFFVIKGSATAVQQPIPGVRRDPFVPQGGTPGTGMQGNFGSAFAQQPQSGTPGTGMQGNFGSAFAQQPQSGTPGTGMQGNFGSAFAQQGAPQQSFGTGNTAPQQSGAFGAGNGSQQSVTKQGTGASPYSTATLETTQIPYIPGISLGPDPSKRDPSVGGAGAAPSQTPGSTAPLGPSSSQGPRPLGPSSSQGPQPLGPSSILDGSQSESASILGNTPAPAVSPLSSAVKESAAEAPAAGNKEEKKDEQGLSEEEAAQLRAMAFATSRPAVLPLGGGGANVQATSQPATLPLGVSPTTVSNHNFDIPVPQSESEENKASTQSPMGASPLYGTGPAQQPQSAAPTQQSPMGASPLYGTAPAAPAAAKPAQPEEDENAPLYADNTEMKKVFKGAFANSNNNNNYN